MPHYFFAVTVNGKRDPDGEAVELTDDSEARQEAIAAATEIAREPFAGDKQINIEVRGSADPVCTVTLRLTVNESSRASGSNP